MRLCLWRRFWFLELMSVVAEIDEILVGVGRDRQPARSRLSKQLSRTCGSGTTKEDHNNGSVEEHRPRKRRSCTANNETRRIGNFQECHLTRNTNDQKQESWQQCGQRWDFCNSQRKGNQGKDWYCMGVGVAATKIWEDETEMRTALMAEHRLTNSEATMDGSFIVKVW